MARVKTYGHYASRIGLDPAKNAIPVGHAMHTIGAACVFKCVPVVPLDESGPPTNPDDYYFAVRDLFPNVSTDDDVLRRLAAFVMRMCQLRMEAHAGPLM